ncbi:MAG: GNAT family N-acetyltransferase [Clostridiales bacterium]|nr:GNAT family N-acetyltransferase [Clostridiales bacterium]
MKKPIERQFIRCGQRNKWMLKDDLIALRPASYHRRVSIMNAKSMIFEIIDIQSRNVAGEIALRIGESDSLFYLGHIGYHINPPYRGKHAAVHACLLCFPLLRELGMTSIVLTTDVDNIASMKTCEYLGCELESTVEVPYWCSAEYTISTRKLRYVLEIPE